jgi:protoporphyrin/coproporphyrin ferrochelatase
MHHAPRTIHPPIGVLVMAYGGPNSLDDLPGYLADIRAGRPTTPEVLEEITNNYRQIGGKSPLLAMTHAQMDALAAHFDPTQVRFYLGMRHWSPWIEETVRQMVDDGITHAISLVLAPHFSSMSIAKYQKKIKEALKMVHADIEFQHIMSYHDAPKYITALANRVREGLAEFPPDEAVHVILSAHSLPVRILKEGDPYDSQLRESAALIATEAGLRDDQWSWSYQSAGRSPEPWLGPQLQDHIADLARQGVKNIVSVPIGFVSDHVEILFDIDIQAQEVAQSLGIRLVRPPALNTDPLFIAQLAELVQEKLNHWVGMPA